MHLREEGLAQGFPVEPGALDVLLAVDRHAARQDEGVADPDGLDDAFADIAQVAGQAEGHLVDLAAASWSGCWCRSRKCCCCW